MSANLFPSPKGLESNLRKQLIYKTVYSYCYCKNLNALQDRPHFNIFMSTMSMNEPYQGITLECRVRNKLLNFIFNKVSDYYSLTLTVCAVKKKLKNEIITAFGAIVLYIKTGFLALAYLNK